MKKSRLIASLAIFFVLAMSFPSCNKLKGFNIEGDWEFVLKISGETILATYTFTGDQRTGHVIWDGDDVGTYSVSGDQVAFTLQYFDADDDLTVEVYQGVSDDDDNMHGTFTYTVEGYPAVSGTWSAERY